MDTGGDRGERGEHADGSGSGISRRHFVAGGMFSLAGASQVISGRTKSAFSSSGSAGGSVGVATLNRSIEDYSSNSDDVRYEIGYQVLIDSGFQSIDVTVENLTDGITWEYPNRTDLQGVVVHDQSGKGNYGYNDQYRITYDVNVGSPSDPVITEIVMDQADGTDPENNDDVSNPNSPGLEWLVVDDSSHNNTGVSYDVYYEVTNVSEFSEMRITFEDKDGSWATRTVTNSNQPIGTVSHSQGNHQHSFDIVAQVRDSNELTVDEATVSDVADGNDPSNIGTPALADSPALEGFTVVDNTSSSGVEYVVDYDLSTTNRLARVDLVFTDTTHGRPPWRESDQAPPDDPITWTADAWREGHTFEIQVEVWETRNGVTFPVDSGTVEDVAEGTSGQSYP